MFPFSWYALESFTHVENDMTGAYFEMFFLMHSCITSSAPGGFFGGIFLGLTRTSSTVNGSTVSSHRGVAIHN